MSHLDRVVVLIDMDCFYCQVEEKLDPELEGQPIAVVQYNSWSGGIIAVNYVARDQGVTRRMRGDQAKAQCPTLKLVKVPELRGKANLTKYREAGKKVADILQSFTPLLMRASIDEAYLDITDSVTKRIETNLSDLTMEKLQNTFIVGFKLRDFLDNVKRNNDDFNQANLKLAMGAVITEEIRAEVYRKTGYKCSAGIAHNKILAKLVCSLHKPNKQTVLPHAAIPEFYKTAKITKITGLGGKFGQSLVEDLGITFMAELGEYSEKELAQRFDEKSARWLYNLARGIDAEPVTPKMLAKSIATSKNFLGRATLTTAESIEHWLTQLSRETQERLDKDFEENNRRARQMTVNFSQGVGKKNVSSSRTLPLNSYDYKKIAQNAFDTVKKFCMKSDGSFCVRHLGISVGNFDEIGKNFRDIASFFNKMTTNDQQSSSRLVEASHSTAADDDDAGICFTGNDNKARSDFTADNYNNSNESLEENASNNDIYSDTTLETDEDSADFVFYDDRCIDDSEVRLNTQKGPEVGNSQKSPVLSSFFHRYFKASAATTASHSPTDRNVAAKNDSSNKTKVPSEDCRFVETAQETNEAEYPTTTTGEPTDICPECHKKIPVLDMISHQDYHFAVKLSKEERSSVRATTTTSTEMSQSNRKKSETSKRGKKRKSSESNQNNNNLLTSFFKKQDDLVDPAADDDEDDGSCETCQECHKKIKLDEILSHMDYHAARKLHQEINFLRPSAVTTRTAKASKSPKGGGGRQKHTDSPASGSVMSFLKPLS